VDVTAWDREAAGGDAGVGKLHGAGVGGATFQHLALVRQFGFLGCSDHPAHDTRIGDHAAVFDLDRRAFAEGDFHFAAFGRIARAGDIYGQTEVGIETEGSARNTPNADFFLRAEDEVKFVGCVFQAAQGFDQDGTADAVVHGFGDQAATQVEERTLERGHLADFDRTGLAVRRADINKELLESIGFGHIGDALAADDAGGAARETDAHTQQRVRMDTAEGCEADKAILVNVGVDQADLVHVCGEHDLLNISSLP